MNCPTPTKRRFADYMAAWSLAEWANRKRQRNVEPYKCRCGCWHLGSVDYERRRRSKTRKERKANVHQVTL